MSDYLSIKSDNELDLKEYEFRFGENQEVICTTDSHAPSTNKIVVEATNGYIPLWHEGSTLHWRFNQRSMAKFNKPEKAKDHFRHLLDEAQKAWGWCPVSFQEASDSVDFEYGLTAGDDCNANGGCVLASAFFPGTAMQNLLVYPKLLNTSLDYQIGVMVHEIGHIFGLRHFFAKISEENWASEIFGEHVDFSIMNYGSKSVLTDADRRDLKNLYEGFWSARYAHINGTRILGITPRSHAARQLAVA